MARRRRSHTRTEPRKTGAPGTALSVLAGSTKSQVIIRLRSGRTSMPCGLKPSVGGRSGHSWTSCSAPSNSATRPGEPPVAEPIMVTRKPPFGSGTKASVMLECNVPAENRNRGAVRVRDIEEEYAVLVAEHAEQAAAGEDVLVGGEPTVVRLIVDAARPRYLGRPDDVAIARRVRVVVNDHEPVRRLALRITGPDVKVLAPRCARGHGHMATTRRAPSVAVAAPPATSAQLPSTRRAKARSSSWVVLDDGYRFPALP